MMTYYYGKKAYRPRLLSEGNKLCMIGYRGSSFGKFGNMFQKRVSVLHNSMYVEGVCVCVNVILE